MSARQPFFPVGAPSGGASRPPTRNSRGAAETPNPNGTTAQFMPDLSNPLHAFSGAGPASTTSNGKSEENTQPKVNVSGLGGMAQKKKKGTLAGPGEKGQSSVGLAFDASNAFRPPTADPHGKAKAAGTPQGYVFAPENGREGTAGNSGGGATSMNPFSGKHSGFARRESAGQQPMHAPVAVPASVPLLTNSSISPAFGASSHGFPSFKSPASFVQGLGLGHAAGAVNGSNQQQPDQGFRPFGRNTPNTSSETLIERGESGSFDNSRVKDLHYTPSGITGPRRIFVDDNGLPISGHVSGSGARQHQAASKKRSHQEVDAEQQDNADMVMGYDAPEARMKIAKLNGHAQQHHQRISMESEFSYTSPHDRREGRVPVPMQQGIEDQECLDEPMSQPCQTEGGYGGPLCSGELDALLRVNVDDVVRRNREKFYDENVQRWKNCSMEEWLRGPEELASQFEEILTLVKEQMMSQIRFYADIDLKLDDYNEQLNEQQSVLDSTKQRVLKEGGTILN